MVAENSGVLGHKLSADFGLGYHIIMCLKKEKRPDCPGRCVETRSCE